VLKKVLTAIVAVIVLFVAVVAVQPSTYQVNRTLTMNAAPEAVYPVISDFHKWDGWSPWAKIDPAMKTAYEGPTAAPGSIYKWVGNDQVGEGQMTILETQPPERVKIKLDFLKPFASTSITEFTVQPAAGGSNVSWTMSGDSSFIAKGFGLFMGGMDKMIGPDFEKGLAQMKVLVEKK
jgi:uncharacterized protein YndB with AHSA1/START domain